MSHVSSHPPTILALNFSLPHPHLSIPVADPDIGIPEPHLTHPFFRVCASLLLGPDELPDSLWCLSVCLLVGLPSPRAASADGFGSGV